MVGCLFDWFITLYSLGICQKNVHTVVLLFNMVCPNFGWFLRCLGGTVPSDLPMRHATCKADACIVVIMYCVMYV
jgi:hypothetical protein